MFKRYTNPNTPELWDKIWKPTSKESDLYNIKRNEVSICWKKMEQTVLKEFGSFKGLNVLEIGSGGGTRGLLFALRGSNVTVLDYSKKALIRAKEFYKRQGITVKTIHADALHLPKNLHNKFDVSLSFGLIEHFENKTRTKMMQAHKDVLKKNGMTFISVPNKWNPPYRIYKAVFEAIGKWQFGLEIPYSRKELLERAKACELHNTRVIGGSFISSFDYINPLKYIKYALGIKKNIKHIKREIPSCLDDTLSYGIILIGKK